MAKTIIEKNDAPVVSQQDLQTIKAARFTLRALDHKLRQTMLSLIDKKDEIVVTEIYSKLKLQQSVASQHLAILRRAGFVKIRKDGKFRYYSVNHGTIRETVKLSKSITQLMVDK